MKKYSAMAATVADHDYPKRAAHKLGVSEDVALALESHVDQYADMKVLNELRRQTAHSGHSEAWDLNQEQEQPP
jgi:hypothetical protein